MIFINGLSYPRFETGTWDNLEMAYFGFVNLQSYLTINSPYSNTCNITHANLNTKKVVGACKSFVYPITVPKGLIPRTFAKWLFNPITRSPFVSSQAIF